MLSRATWCVRKYPINDVVRKHRNSRKESCSWFFSVFSVFFVLCIFVRLGVLFVLFGERFYEGLISILDSGVFGPIV